MNTRQLHIGCIFRYNATYPTAAVFHVEALESARVSLSDVSLAWDGEAAGAPPLHPFVDHLGNRRLRAELPVGPSELTWAAVATLPDTLDEHDADAVQLTPRSLPDEVLPFTLPSRFCQSVLLGHEAWSRFGSQTPNMSRVMDIMDFVHGHLAYTSGATTSTTTALDVFETGKGVCRDYAHLMISLCRALNLPARYAFGYLPDMDVEPIPTPMDFHAWVQVFVGDRWYDFDPRHNALRKGRVLVGVGTDAADSAMVTTFGGPTLERMRVICHEVGTEPLFR